MNQYELYQQNHRWHQNGLITTEQFRINQAAINYYSSLIYIVELEEKIEEVKDIIIQ